MVDRRYSDVTGFVHPVGSEVRHWLDANRRRDGDFPHRIFLSESCDKAEAITEEQQERAVLIKQSSAIILTYLLPRPTLRTTNKPKSYHVDSGYRR